MKTNPAVLFLSHGGGPYPLLGDPQHIDMCKTLEDIVTRIPKPSTILVVSAHWEERVPTLISSTQPPLYYDYSGFPRESYEIKYPAKGHPAFVQKLQEHLRKEGIDSNSTNKRGFDHGMFVPLKIMYPDADIPVVQLSLVSSLNPKFHIDLGRALKKFPHEDENLLVIGSGFSFHNMRAFFGGSDRGTMAKNLAFDKWLHETIASKEMSEDQREKALLEWTKAPAARFCHPREEHLMPLHFCYGAAGRASDEAFSLMILGKHSSMFLWNAGEESETCSQN